MDWEYNSLKRIYMQEVYYKIHLNDESSLSHLPYTAPVELTPDLPDTTDIVSPLPNRLTLDNNDEE